MRDLPYFGMAKGYRPVDRGSVVSVAAGYTGMLPEEHLVWLISL
jgi:hypothetical protein